MAQLPHPNFDVIKKDLEKFNINDLDAFEDFQYNNFMKGKMSKAEALQIIINTVEGDYSQLSPSLAKLAIKQDEEAK